MVSLFMACLPDWKLEMCFTYLKLQPKQDKRAESKISYVITDLVEQ